MRSASALFGSAVVRTHRLAVEVSARIGTSGALTVLPLSGGAMQASRSKAVRRSVDITVPGREWVDSSESPTWLLSPYAAELVVKRGIRYPDGSEELLTLGVFVVTSAQIDRDQGSVSVHAEDRFYRFVDDRFETPRKPAANASTFAVLTTLIQETIPGLSLVTTGITDRAYPGTQVWEESRVQALQDIALSLGCEIYAQSDGTIRIRKPPTMADVPVHTINGAGPDAVIVSADTEQSREGVYNSVSARSAPTDPDTPIVRAVIRDNGATSPTKWGGNFGKKVRFYSSPLLTSTAQCQDAARAILSNSVGLRKSLDLASVPDPRLEEGDVVNVDYGITSEKHILEDMTIPLVNSGDMTAASRAAVDTGDLT